jgi:large subunit ribosomal protein L3
MKWDGCLPWAEDDEGGQTMKGLIAKKIGMTQFFAEDGRLFPVTVLRAGPNVVVQKKTSDGEDGYNAVKLGFGDVHKKVKEGAEPQWRMTKPMLGVFQKAGLEEPRQELKEFRITATELDTYEVGKDLGPADLFQEGQYVDVTGTSKGKGFAGVMKRHNFHGALTMTHGTHEYFRHAGSIGASADPAKVVRGKRMPGQYGNATVTVQNLHIIEIDADQNLIMVKGGVPGHNGCIVYIKQAIKKPMAHKSPAMKEGEEA